MYLFFRPEWARGRSTAAIFARARAAHLANINLYNGIYESCVCVLCALAAKCVCSYDVSRDPRTCYIMLPGARENVNFHYGSALFAHQQLCIQLKNLSLFSICDEMVLIYVIIWQKLQLKMYMNAEIILAE
jgi:hypothetical protein